MSAESLPLIPETPAHTSVWSVEEFGHRVAARRTGLLKIARNLTKGDRRFSPEDLVSKAIERTLAAYEQFKTDKTTEEERIEGLHIWMFVIMRNVWLDELRKRRRRGEQQVAEGFEMIDSSPDPERMLMAKDLVEKSMRALKAHASPEQYEALYLLVTEDMSYEEIAEWQSARSGTEVQVGTVKSRLSRARAILKKIVAEDLEI